MKHAPWFSAVLCAAACGLLLAATPAAAEASQPAPRRPNIILVMVDDMGFSDIGCYGGEIQTPNLDRLASEGIRFTQFYNNAKCTTTRASLITGLYPRPTGSLLKPEMVTIADVLRQAGYHTALSGKWHLGATAPNRPSDRGFDKYFSLLDGCCNFFDPNLPDPDFKGGKVRVVAEDDVLINEFPDGFYMTDAISEYAAERIREYAGSDRPFFLHVCYTAPHYPLHAKLEDIAKYEGTYQIGWDVLRRQRHERQVAMGLIDPHWTLPGPDRDVAPWNEAQHQDYMAELMAVYAAMVDSMDQGMGRILRQVDESGVRDNTLVIFLSDNGGCAEKPGGIDPTRTPGVEEYYTAVGPGWAYAQNTPFRRFKQYVHEGGISSPLIVRWPGVAAPNTLVGEVGHIIDILPTCAEAAGTEYPRTHNGHDVIPVEGLSLVSLLAGESRTGHDTLCWEWNGNRAIRQGDWKLSYEKSLDDWELYNMVADRTETNDLSDAQPERTERMKADWFEWAEATGQKSVAKGGDNKKNKDQAAD